MKLFTSLMMLFLLSDVPANETSTLSSRLDISMKTEPISASMSVVEQKVRKAAVRVTSSRGGHGSGSLIKYKGVTLVLTAHHVADGPMGGTYYVSRQSEGQSATLVYSDAMHDIAILYIQKEFDNATPLKYSPRKDAVEVGSEITYSGYPSTHQLMTFRGRVAGYEFLHDAGMQILLHTHGYFGCSGSIVYDSNGDIVGILWGIDVEYEPTHHVVENLIWIQPIHALNMGYAMEGLCRAMENKSRACK